MRQVIYIDVLFLLNLGMNYLVLLVTAKITAVHVSRLRIALGALLGAGYAVLAVVPSLGFLAAAPMKLVSGAAIVLAVFGKRREILRPMVVFFAVSAAFGGAVYAISLGMGGGSQGGHLYLPISLKVLALSFALCYGALTLVFSRLGRDTGAKLVQIEVGHRGKSVQFTGLVDTGNSLRDPIGGGGVLVVETEALASLFSREVMALFRGAQADKPVELLPLLQQMPGGLGFYLIPYTAVGVRGGFLLAFRPERVSMEGREKRGLSLALSPTRVSDGGRYSALVNGGVL